MKRQKELKRQQKREEKAAKKRMKKEREGGGDAPAETPAGDEGSGSLDDPAAGSGRGE